MLLEKPLPNVQLFEQGSQDHPRAHYAQAAMNHPAFGTKVLSPRCSTKPDEDSLSTSIRRFEDHSLLP
jgi:hypothetical protein